MPENTAYNLRSNFSRTNFADLSVDYQAAYDWFTSFGFNVAVTRLRKYKDCIDELAKHYQQGTLDKVALSRTFERQATALSEATEIMRIHKGLVSLCSSSLKDKLHPVLSGTDGRPNPSEFDPSRDIAFELLLASRCQQAGLRIEIGSDADLIILFKGVEIFVECKRLKSNGNGRKLVKDAIKQLHRRYKSASCPLSARGIVALSITDHANPTHGLMPGFTAEEVGKRVERHVDAFILKHQDLWQPVVDKRTIGVFVELSAPAVIESEHLFTTCHQVGVNNACHERSSDMRLLFDFAHKLAMQDD